VIHGTAVSDSDRRSRWVRSVRERAHAGVAHDATFSSGGLSTPPGRVVLVGRFGSGSRKSLSGTRPAGLRNRKISIEPAGRRT
jgi:hypothetical protein